MKQEAGEEEEEGDPVQALEQRQMESQREMEIMDALQEIRARNARLDKTDTDTLLQTVVHGKRKMEPQTETELEQRRADEEDEEIVRRVFRREARGQDTPEADGDPRDTVQESMVDNHIANSSTDRNASPETSAKPETSDAPEAPAPASTTGDTVVVKQAPSEPPSATLLLSEGARDHLASLSRPKPASKRRRQNALGVVQKRV